MKKYIILGLVLLLLLAGFLTLISSSPGNYITTPQYTNSHTKAICNEQNLCQDYEIFCEDKDIVYMLPITGAVVQFSEDWQDPRDKEIRNDFC